MIVVRDRAVARLLAVLPAVVIAAAVRVLTLGTPPAALRVAAAGVVAIAAWSAYRLLTARVTVTDEALHVRGVLYEADVPFAELQSVHADPAPWPVRVVAWGIMRPRAVRVVTRTTTLRPIALFSGEGDEQVEQAMRALLIRCGTRLIPAQREPMRDVVSSTD